MAINKHPSFGSTIMDGMALGVGSSLGHRAMDILKLCWDVLQMKWDLTLPSAEDYLGQYYYFWLLTMTTLLGFLYVYYLILI